MFNPEKKELEDELGMEIETAEDLKAQEMRREPLSSEIKKAEGYRPVIKDPEIINLSDDLDEKDKRAA